MNPRFLITAGALAFLLGFSSCVQDITTTSVVNNDGSVERIITFTDADSALAEKNIFGVTASDGWKTDIGLSTNKTEKGENLYNITFQRSFNSVESANEAMARDSGENFFMIKSTLEKRFRWFFTYYDYSDTYLKLDRLDSVRQEDYFTPEDYAFIERLPAEGKTIPRNDNFFLNKLHERILDHYLTDEIRAQISHAINVAMRQNTTDTAWLKVYRHRLPEIIDAKVRDSGELEAHEVLDQFLRLVVKETPVDTSRVHADYRIAYKPFDDRLSFLTEASRGKYTHVIRLPWDVVTSNADSVAGDALVWQPPTIKMYLKDYTMYATGRSLNWWAVIVSAGIVIGTAYLFSGKNKRHIN